MQIKIINKTYESDLLNNSTTIIVEYFIEDYNVKGIYKKTSNVKKLDVNEDDIAEVIDNKTIADAIAKQYYVNELISFVKLDDSIIKYINEYLDNVSSEFYLDEKELYDTDEEYQKAVWNQTFYEGGVAYCDLIKTIIKNL